MKPAATGSVARRVLAYLRARPGRTVVAVAILAYAFGGGFIFGGLGSHRASASFQYEYSTTITTSTTTTLVFTVSLSGQPLAPVTVDYATADGAATAGSDYLPTSGTLGFAPGVSTRTITVTVLGDGLQEPSETFSLNLSNPSPNAYLGDSQGLATIAAN